MRFLSIMLMLTLSGCFVTTLPMSSSLSDGIMMNLKPSTRAVTFAVSSSINDGTIIPTDNAGNPIQAHPGYVHTEASSFGKMVTEYLSSKFKNGNDVSVNINLTKFEITQFTNESTGSQFMKAMLTGGETNFQLSAKITGRVSVTIDGQVHEKVIISSSDGTYIQGIGTGTDTSNIYRGKDSIEHVHAQNINKANNKFIVQLNLFLSSLNL